MTDINLNPKRRRAWKVAVPLVLLLTLIAGAWIYAKTVVQAEVVRQFDAFIAREKTQGRVHDCVNRDISTYLFSVEVSCDTPVLRFMTPQGPATISFARFKSLALVYNPRHIITDFASPLLVSLNGAQIGRADFTRAQTSFRYAQGRFERFSLETDNASGVFAGGRDVSAAHAEMHIRPKPETLDDYDFALETKALHSALRPELGSVNIKLASTVLKWPRLSQAPQDSKAALASWAQSGGGLAIEELHVVRGKGQLLASGQIVFTPAGRAQGAIDAKIADSAALFGGGLAMQNGNDMGAMLGAALMFLPKSADIKGEKATQLNVKITNGVAAIGPLQLNLPPLF